MMIRGLFQVATLRGPCGQPGPYGHPVTDPTLELRVLFAESTFPVYDSLFPILDKRPLW